MNVLPYLVKDLALVHNVFMTDTSKKTQKLDVLT